MNTKKPMPRALSPELGSKLSEWIYKVSCLFDTFEEKQEELFSIIRSTEDPTLINSVDEKDTIRDLLSFMLTMSFIVLREKEAIEEFYNDYNGF